MRQFLLLLVFISLSVNAENASYEYEIKAAFIYNFINFVEWPQSDSKSDTGSFNVCILGDNRLSAASKTIQGKPVQGKILQVKHIANAGEHEECDLIFFAISNTERLQRALESIKGESVLSVGESNDFIDKGGVIGLYIENNIVKFEINQLAAIDNGLQINSQLLELASRVIQ